jgi:hypothetical protein
MPDHYCPDCDEAEVNCKCGNDICPDCATAQSKRTVRRSPAPARSGRSCPTDDRTSRPSYAASKAGANQTVQSQ